MKNGKTGLIILVAILAIILVLEVSDFKITQVTKPSLSDAYHTQIDPFQPEYLDTLKINCAAHSGDWYDEHDKIGCFNIDIPWDSTLCNSPQILVQKNICNGVGGVYVCNTDDVGCYY